jgi:hypothetical protein
MRDLRESARWRAHRLRDALGAARRAARLRRMLRRRPPARTLAEAEAQLCSQNGEDGVLAELLDRTGPAGRWFVEFGAGPGLEGNCVLLADALGWHGLFIEADPVHHRLLEHKYRANRRVTTLHGRVVPANVEAMLAGAGVPRDFDVLSIDVDGNDYWIWRALRGFAPRIVVIEYNASLGGQDALTQPLDEAHEWDGTTFFGASIRALEELGRARGYRLVHLERAGVNAFFVREDVAGGLEAVAPRPPAALPALAPDPLGRRFVAVSPPPAADAP